MCRGQGTGEAGESRASSLPETVWYLDGMKTTIDKAGRVVIPAAIRARARLRPGTVLEVMLENDSVLLVRSAPGPKRVRRGSRWIFKPTAESDVQVDVEALVERERDRWPL